MPPHALSTMRARAALANMHELVDGMEATRKAEKAADAIRTENAIADTLRDITRIEGFDQDEVASKGMTAQVAAILSDRKRWLAELRGEGPVEVVGEVAVPPRPRGKGPKSSSSSSSSQPWDWKGGSSNSNSSWHSWQHW